MNLRTREGWADVAKGVCIILVVFWHVITKHVHFIDWGSAEGIASLWATFSAQLLPLRMPLFFLVSGLFAASAVFAADRAKAGRRVGLLLSLYVLWLTIQTFALALAAPDFDTARAHNVVEYLAELTISPTNLWYLLALGLYLVIARTTRKVPTPIVLSLAFIVSGVMGMGVLPDLGNLWQVIQNLFFFLLGVRMRDLVKRIAASVNVWTALAAGAVFAAGIGGMALLNAREWFGVWTLLCLAAVYFGMSWCVLLDRWLPRMTKPLGWIGQRTLPIYVIHMLPLAVIDRVVRGTGAAEALANPAVALVYPLLLTAAVIAICLLAHNLLNRIGRGFLFNPLVVLPRKEPAAAGTPAPVNDATLILPRQPRAPGQYGPGGGGPVDSDATMLLPRQRRTPNQYDPDERGRV
ncbi:acyltransferase family protein [Glycomyces harbinensis]|uniref:Uncharacterized membrane protein YcfT n=1 Tax=Glycomyces harbinensis TaxID=58114 RepID=A0A1G6YQZ7_9ACTN|nr:acyltransferase family protein [Glycomyces harbinensis]SDD92730.1 Uncharacterized membrane protein YcfT [Glycomyces harbinensis]